MKTESRLRAAIVCAILALVCVIAVWILSRGFSTARAFGALAAVAPLCAFVPALARGNRRAYAALTLCLVAYITFSLMELVANPAARTWASVSVLASFLLFAMSVAYLRVTRER